MPIVDVDRPPPAPPAGEEMVRRPPSQLTAPMSEATAVAALVLNVLMPGVGSLVAGRIGKGLAQLTLWLLGLPLCLVLIGFPMVIGSWIWSLSTSIGDVDRAHKASAFRR